MTVTYYMKKAETFNCCPWQNSVYKHNVLKDMFHWVFANPRVLLGIIRRWRIMHWFEEDFHKENNIQLSRNLSRSARPIMLCTCKVVAKYVFSQRKLFFSCESVLIIGALQVGLASWGVFIVLDTYTALLCTSYIIMLDINEASQKNHNCPLEVYRHINLVSLRFSSALLHVILRINLSVMLCDAAP